MRAARRLACGVALAAACAACRADPPSPSPSPATPAAAPPPVASAPVPPKVVTERRPAATWDADRPAYASAADLCRYLNDARGRGRDHQRFRGEPWRGTYHDTRTWPDELAIDAALSVEAQAEADRLAREGGPKGRSYRDSSWRRPVWVDGIGSERPQLAARDLPGDWDPATDVQARAALIETNGAVRLALLHQDGGGEGPVLHRMGCGGARSADGRSRWWVVVLGP